MTCQTVKGRARVRPMTKAQRIGASLLLSLVAILIPASAAHARTNPCPTATSHLWCGVGNNDGNYDRTYHWWELGICGWLHGPDGCESA